MNKLILSAVLCAGLATYSGVNAQSVDGLKVGVVNVGRLLQESPQATAAREALEDEFGPRRRSIVSMQTALEEKTARMQQNAEVMGPQERENAQRELRNDEREVLRAQNEFREDLDVRNNEAIGAVQRDVLREIATFGESNAYDLILADGIVYASGRVDVTPQILEQLKAGFAAPSAGR